MTTTKLLKKNTTKTYIYHLFLLRKKDDYRKEKNISDDVLCSYLDMGGHPLEIRCSNLSVSKLGKRRVAFVSLGGDGFLEII